MRSRNREVNIFNMSLLDILTGMLGAFLFLMLGLVPYYTKAKKKNGDEPIINCVLNIAAHWNNPAKLDIFLMSPDGQWRGFNNESIPLSRRTKITDNSTAGGKGWQTTSCFAHEGDRFLLAVSLQEPASPQSLSYTSLTMELMEAKIDPTGSGLAGYYPDMFCTFMNVSAIKPGQVYGAMWIEVTKDTNKKEYYRQYDFNTALANKYPMPPGVLPVPTPIFDPASYTNTPAPISNIPPPSYSNNPVPPLNPPPVPRNGPPFPGNNPPPGLATTPPAPSSQPDAGNSPSNPPENDPGNTPNPPSSGSAKRTWFQFFFPSWK